MTTPALDPAGTLVEMRPKGSGGLQRFTMRTFDPALEIRSLDPLNPLDVGKRRWFRVGWWWSCTNRAHVTFGSVQQRTFLMVLDADPKVSWIVHSPIALSFGALRIVPAYLIQRGDDLALVFGKATGSPDETDESLALVREFCGAVGWKLMELEDLSSVAKRNLHWLAGYRHARNNDDKVGVELRNRFHQPRPLWEGVEQVGALPHVLPVAYHLLWSGRLCMDLETALDSETVVWSRV